MCVVKSPSELLLLLLLLVIFSILLQVDVQSANRAVYCCISIVRHLHSQRLCMDV